MILVTKDQFLGCYQNRKLAEHNLHKRSYKLPIKSSRELAGIVADILTDGHLGKNMIIYYSKNTEELESFANRIQKLFSVNYSIRDVTPDTPAKMVVIFDRNLMKILNLCGVPTGPKVLVPYKFPDWIQNSSNAVVAEFLSRLFGNDGCITFNGNRIEIKLKQHKAEHILDSGKFFMNEIRSLLVRFDIKSTNVCASGYTLRKDGIKTIGLGFEIQGTRKNLKNIENFHTYINFSNLEKKHKLEKSLKTLRL